MTYAGRVAVLGAVLVLAAGCGRDDAEPPVPADPPPATSAPTTTPTPPGGQDAAGELSEFVCAPDQTGAWDASGVLTPTEPGDYSVTVVVTGPDDASAPGRRRVLAGLQPGTPEPFELLDVPAVGAGDLTCQVRVLRLTD